MRPLRPAGVAITLLSWNALAQISGRVVAGGMPPPEPVLVTVRCPGFTPWTGYTDKHGEFAAPLPNIPDAPNTASAGGASGACRVEASARGFQRSVLDVPNNEAGGLLLNLKPLVTSEASVPYADVGVPQPARKVFDKAAREINRQNWIAAETDLRKAIKLYPAYGQAWNELGHVLQNRGKTEDAKVAYKQAIAVDGKLMSAFARLAVLDATQQRWDAVAATTDAAINGNRDAWPSLYFYNAVAKYNLGRIVEAEASVRRAIALDTTGQFPRTHYILGHILIARGEYRAGAEEMSKYIHALPDAADGARVRAEIQDAESRKLP